MLFARDLAVAARNRAILAAYLRLARIHRAIPPHDASIAGDELTWGETPLATAVDFLRAANVTSTSRVVDLGAGRGMVLLAARLLGASARGVELDPRRALPAVDVLANIGATLVVGDARDANLDDATHVFAAWTCMTPETRAVIAERIPRDTTLIALTWDPPSSSFAVIARNEASFSWGRATVVTARRR